MGKYTRYFTGALGWLLFIAGLFAAYNVNINGMNPNYPELPTFEQANTLIFMQIGLLVSGAVLLFCTRVLTLMEGGEDG
jgi:hypothetical protein